MKYPSIPLAQTVLSLCRQSGIDKVVISPGSRNAPLTLGFSENTYFECFSIVDERCAAFFALGMAQQLRRPVALLCTSGSALLNYYPAVAEAFYSTIPLVVISADRPEYRIDIGDGQTIRHDRVFDRHILYSTQLRQDVSHATEKFRFVDSKQRITNTYGPSELVQLQKEIQHHNEEQLLQALHIAIEDKGPVHINTPFEEPLYEMVDTPDVAPAWVEEDGDRLDVHNLGMNPLVDVWNASKRKMVLVGTLSPNEISNDLLEGLANDSSVVVFTETTSNLHHPNFFPSIDKIIAPLEIKQDGDSYFEQLKPDILLTFGGMVVSKKIKAFLRKHSPEHHWHIDDKKAYNTFFCLEKHIRLLPRTFLRAFLKKTKETPSDYYGFWDGVREKRSEKHKEYLEKVDFGDLKTFEILLQNIPEQHQLQLGNSSTIRYVQLFDLSYRQTNFCNRGTSGIDGSTSTAIGASQMHKEGTTLITGDLSFFYDSNALWNAYIRPDFRIIVINNGGGGIFRILPGNKDSQNFETFFETTHQLHAKPLAELHGFDYRRADDEVSLKNILSEFFQPSLRPRILEVFTPRTENDQQLLAYFDFLK